MRLAPVREEHPPEKRELHEEIRARSGAEVADIALTLHHRPEFFGDDFAAWSQAVMRGPSAWSEGERELMAALVSARNQCVF